VRRVRAGDLVGYCLEERAVVDPGYAWVVKEQYCSGFVQAAGIGRLQKHLGNFNARFPERGR